MKRKIFLSVFVAIIVAMPAMSHAGFFDFLKFDFKNLGAQAKTSISAEVRAESFIRGDKNPEISYIQELLTEKGYYDGKISGSFGSITEKAILNWQAKNDLEATGTLDKVTIESIAGITREEDDERGGGDIPMNLKMILGGSYNSGTGLMSTALNDANLIPLQEPYSALGYSFQEGGGEMTTADVFNATGPNAIVDWVIVELRDRDSMAWGVPYSRAALLQADGDVVEADGVSPVLIQDQNPGYYYVLVGHRNHLSVITETPVDIEQPLDMTTAALYYDISEPNQAAKIMNGKQVLWPGDVNRDNFIKYAGDDNDRDVILQTIGGTVPTATISNEYRLEDVNMDGMVKYAGANNDRDVILQSIGGGVPTNVVEAQLPELSPVIVELVSTEEVSSSDGVTSDWGTFEITFNVTATQDDIVIPETSELTNNIHTANEGVEYVVLKNGGQITVSASSVLVNNTDSDLAPGGGYQIEDGETEEFTLTVTFQPQTDGLYKIIMNTLNWGFYTGALNADEFYTIDLGYSLGSQTEFDTDYLFLNAI